MPRIDAKNDIYLSTTSYTTKNLAKTQKQYDKVAQELSTGGESGDFSTVSNPKQFINFQSIYNRNESYVHGCEYNSGKTTSMITVVDQIREIASKMQTEISLARSSPLASQQNFTNQANDYLRQLTSLLNNQFTGSYTFAGTKNSIAPVVDLLTLPSILPGSGPDTSYYQGSTSPYTFQAADDLLISINVKADNPGFEQLIRALRLCKDASISAQDTTNIDRLTQANDLCNTALQSMIQDDATLRSYCSQLENTIEKIKIDNGLVGELIQKFGYTPIPEIMGRYFEEKTNMALQQEISMQSTKQLKNFLDNFPR